jgi:hypothetical protein
MPHEVLPSGSCGARNGKRLCRLGSNRKRCLPQRRDQMLGGGGCTREMCHRPSSHRNSRSAQWQLALDLVARSGNLRCSCHAVERIPSAGRGRAAQFVPIRFAFTNKLTRHDKRLLAFDAVVISKVFRREVTLGRIIKEDDRVTLIVKVSALKNEVEKLTDKIGVLISSPSPPDLVLNRHCAVCEFQTVSDHVKT